MNFWQNFSGLFDRAVRFIWGASPTTESVKSDSGIMITAEKVLTISAAWACIKLARNVVSSFPCFVYERQGRNKRLATDHPVYPLLHRQPNVNMTASDFWGVLCAGERTYGNSYARKRMIGERVVALEPMLARYVTPYLDDRTGMMRYRFWDGLRTLDLSVTEVVHHKLFSEDGLVGLSPIEFGRHSFGRVLSTEEAAGRTFENGLMPSSVFKYPHVMQPKQRKLFRKNLKSFMGAANAGQPFVLEKGMEMQLLSFKPADAELLLTRGWGVEDVCRWFDTPPPIIGYTDKASSWASSLDSLNRGYLTYCLMPIVVALERRLAFSLLSPAEQERFYVKFSFEGLFRADAQGRAALYSSGAQNGWLTRNEIRELEDYDPMEGGDVLTIQSNLMPADQLGMIPNDPATQVRNALINLLRDPETEKER